MNPFQDLKTLANPDSTHNLETFRDAISLTVQVIEEFQTLIESTQGVMGFDEEDNSPGECLAWNDLYLSHRLDSYLQLIAQQEETL